MGCVWIYTNQLRYKAQEMELLVRTLRKLPGEMRRNCEMKGARR